MSNPLPHRSASEIQDALCGCLRDATWTDADGNTVPAFEQVKSFDALDLPKAMEELVATKGRVALVIVGDDTWETMDRTDEEFAPVLRRRLEVTVLVSDRVIGDRSAALWGNSRHPGCRLLSDVAVYACAGPLFDEEEEGNGEASAVVKRCGRTDIATEQAVEGRAAMAVEMEVFTGWSGLV